AWVQATGLPLGWLTFLLTLAVCLDYFGRRYPSTLVHWLGAGGLALGTLAASSMSWWDVGDGLANHVLILSWTVLGLVMLAVGWVASRRSSGTTFPSAAVWASG